MVFDTRFCRFLRVRPDSQWPILRGFWRFYGGALGLHHFLAAAVGAPCSAALPDLLGKVLPLFLGRFVDDLPAGVVRPSGVLKDSLGVLREGVGTSGVVLSRFHSLASSRQADRL